MLLSSPFDAVTVSSLFSHQILKLLSISQTSHEHISSSQELLVFSPTRLLAFPLSFPVIDLVPGLHLQLHLHCSGSLLDLVEVVLVWHQVTEGWVSTNICIWGPTLRRLFLCWSGNKCICIIMMIDRIILHTYLVETQPRTEKLLSDSKRPKRSVVFVVLMRKLGPKGGKCCLLFQRWSRMNGESSWTEKTDMPEVCWLWGVDWCVAHIVDLNGRGLKGEMHDWKWNVCVESGW